MHACDGLRDGDSHAPMSAVGPAGAPHGWFRKLSAYFFLLKELKKPSSCKSEAQNYAQWDIRHATGVALMRSFAFQCLLARQLDAGLAFILAVHEHPHRGM
jgi:hypothetical protein